MSRGFLGLGLLVAGFLAAAQTGEGAPSAVPAPTALPLVGDAVAGKETFTQYCSICHGVGAKGFIGPYIAGINWTVPGLHTIVRYGFGGYGSMPAFNADAVTDSNIADIVAYLASLPPASASAPVPKSSTTAQVATVAVNAATPAASAAAASSASPVSSASPASAASGVPQTSSSGAGDPIHGRQVYSSNCAACHGASAQGGFGPSLRGEKNRKDTAAAIAWIKNPLPPMPKLYPSVLSEKDVDDVAAYVESL